jgi:DNA-directed RNA polymerase specialized sigma24 family protein
MTMPGSDRDLVVEALRGRTVAFEALVRRHLRAAYAVALARTGSPHDAEDVCQDAFIAALDETRREVALLHDVEGWRHAEIAERLGMPEGTVRYHLHEARRTLRDRLAGRYGKEIHG